MPSRAKCKDDEILREPKAVLESFDEWREVGECGAIG